MDFYNLGMARSAKRKRSSVGSWISDESDADGDPMELDEDGELPFDQGFQSQRTGGRSMRSLRSRETSSRQTPQSPPLAPSNEGDDDDIIQMHEPSKRRSMRTRQPVQSLNYADDRDELANDTRGKSEDDDNFIPFITSDVALQKGRSRPRKLPGRSAGRSGSQSLTKLSARKANGHDDIEFEAPRRSVRSTRNRADMGDDAAGDDESFYVVDDKGPVVPKAISIREVFQPIAPDTAFASVHLDVCQLCSGSRQRGQLVHCQGCSLSYHKNCLGFRSAREHIVTKVGDQDFVLQCRYCVNIYRKKDANAPRHDLCQDCKTPGKSCAGFSSKKTSRQEEKMREENEGTDPITTVSPSLLNNSDNTLFRCIRCYRGWHIEHLPPAGRNPDEAGTDLRIERLKDYSIDWHCNDCSQAKQKIHRLVAWRPVNKSPSSQSLAADGMLTSEVQEDDKEYLIKWEHTSYFHCSWKPGAWIYSVAAGAMRHSFAKRDMEQSQMKLTEKDAIPDEFLMPDVILNIKMDSSMPMARTKHEDFKNIERVKKILVKFQGLGYDDVVWDVPPLESAGKDVWNAYLDAYFDYLEGKYFQSESNGKIRDRIKAYKNAAFEEVDQQPAGLKRGKLMGYQVEGLNWMLENYHANRSIVLADEMGLGKTVQVVSLVASLVQDKPKVSRDFPFSEL